MLSFLWGCVTGLFLYVAYVNFGSCPTFSPYVNYAKFTRPNPPPDYYDLVMEWVSKHVPPLKFGSQLQMAMDHYSTHSSFVLHISTHLLKRMRTTVSAKTREKLRALRPSLQRFVTTISVSHCRVTVSMVIMWHRPWCVYVTKQRV